MSAAIVLRADGACALAIAIAVIAVWSASTTRTTA
jgi:hypothetical protein